MRKFHYSLIFLSLCTAIQVNAAIPLPFGIKTTAADQTSFNTVDKVATSKGVQIEGMANQISEKLKLVFVGRTQASTAIEAHREKQEVAVAMNKIMEDLAQPSNNCEKIKNAAVSQNFEEMTRNDAQFSSRMVSDIAFNGRGRLVEELSTYDNNVRQFCSVQQQADGRCFYAVQSGDLADGDMNVSVLFGSKNDVTRESSQDAAAEAVINHLVGTDFITQPYETKKGTDENGMYKEYANLENLPNNAKRYENLRKRYATVLGMASDGLYSASSSHLYAPVDFADYNNKVEVGQLYEGVQYEDPHAGQRGEAGNENNPSSELYGSMPIDPKSRPAMMADYIVKKASAESLGLCAQYVSDGIINGGRWNYLRPGSAFMAADGRLAKIGFKKIPVNSEPQVGDIMVFEGHRVPPPAGSRKKDGTLKTCNNTGCYHGHIQAYTGLKGKGAWTSDFKQNSKLAGVYYKPQLADGRATLWRHESVIGEPKK